MYKGNERDFVRTLRTRMEARCPNGDKYRPGAVNFKEERDVG